MATQTETITRAEASSLYGPVTATLNYFDPPKNGSVPFDYVEVPPEGMPSSSYGSVEHQVNISDIRNKEKNFSVTDHGFQPLSSEAVLPLTTTASRNVNFDDDESIQRDYYPEVERILLANLDGTPQRVVIFDHTIRKADPNANREPVMRTHVDQTKASAQERVRKHVADPTEAERLIRGRFRLVNVWRPINGRVESFPLAVADSRTLPDADLITVERRYPTFTGQTAAIQFNEATKWYHWSGMTNEERFLLQCFDSQEGGRRTPHTAFIDPRSGKDAKPRESIEVRALIFG